MTSSFSPKAAWTREQVLAWRPYWGEDGRATLARYLDECGAVAFTKTEQNSAIRCTNADGKLVFWLNPGFIHWTSVPSSAACRPAEAVALDHYSGGPSWAVDLPGAGVKGSDRTSETEVSQAICLSCTMSYNIALGACPDCS